MKLRDYPVQGSAVATMSSRAPAFDEKYGQSNRIARRNSVLRNLTSGDSPPSVGYVRIPVEEYTRYLRAEAELERRIAEEARLRN